MQLPKDLITGNYTRPRLFLCETDKSIICQLDPYEMNGVFKFNSYSELSFSVGRTYEDMINGEIKINPYYNKIEALRLVYLEDFGYFEIQDPEIVSDGIKEVKNITANSLEYNLSQKYIENLYINTGEVKSAEYIYASDNNYYDANGNILITPVSFYNSTTPQLSLLHIILEKAYGWKIAHVDDSLKTMTRSFEISRTSVYDFIMQDLCEKFNCFTEFDTINNEIRFYAETLVSKFICDGTQSSFKLTQPYEKIGTVNVGGYKTSDWTYENGVVTLNAGAPASGTIIEITDGAQQKWETDVYVSFDNLAQEVNISYSADDIKTVLTVKGADDLNIRDVNSGFPYITDLSYYYSKDWMGEDLYNAYTAYMIKSNELQDDYSKNSEKMLDLSNYISYERDRLSLQYALASHVNNTTVGHYYIQGGDSPNYYYVQVQLPSEYNAEIEHYYSLSGTSLNETKVEELYKALQKYYSLNETKSFSDLVDSFAFMEYTIQKLINDLAVANTTSNKDTAVNKFLDEMWEQLGLTPLQTAYRPIFAQKEQDDKDAGRDKLSHEDYWSYYPVTLMLASLDRAISQRQSAIDSYNSQYQVYANFNADIVKDLAMDNKLNFTDAQRIRLSAFLREDEYTDDNFIVTDSDSASNVLKTQRELLECGKIELSKLCEPKLAFSMNMANIYALLEFEPIIHQFTLGKLINIEIRPKTATENAYVKRARLLEVNINFDDFSDFSCEFGELTNLRTQSSIHADLLSQALSAGKSVASNASYWNKGADLATSTDLKIQQGLLGATGGIYTSNQEVTIDDSGIWLRKLNPDGKTFSPYQALLTSNNILLSSDGFISTPEMGLGEFTIDGTTFYGMLAKVMMSGYIEGSRIVGGTINIGDGTFMVDQFGNVTMKAVNISGYAQANNIISSINQSPETIAINADKISLTGKDINLTTDDITISSTNFNVTKDGKITATSGEIAGWTINNNNLMKDLTLDNVDYQMYLQSPNGDSMINAFAVRSKATDSDTWETQFAVNYKGKMLARNADITGAITANSLTLGNDVTIPYSKLSGTPDLDIYIAKNGTVGSTPADGSTGFNVSSNGLLQASNAVIYGTIYSSAGKIAGWDINSSSLQKDITIDGTDYQMYLQAPNGGSMVNAFAVRTKESSSTSWDTQFAVNYMGKLTAKNANVSGTITATDGSIAGYNIGSGGSYDNAIYKRVTGDSASYEVGLKSTNGETDLAFYVKKSTDNWENSENTFYVNNRGKLYAQNADITGKITADSGSIGSWTIGDMGSYTDSIYTTYCAASTPSTSNPEYAVFMRGKGEQNTIAIGIKNRTSASTAWTDAVTPFYVRKDGFVKMTNADVTGTINSTSGSIGGFDISEKYLRSDITKSGTRYQTFIQAADGTDTTTAIGVRTSDDNGATWTYQFRVNYDGSAVLRNATITGSSTIASACIPNLNADKITAGTLSVDRIPNISAGKITSGTISTSRLDSSVITTGNFSSKTLSTGSLTVASGCRLGVASEYNALITTVGDYTYLRGFGPDVNYETSFYNLVKYVVQNSSSKEIKNDIHDFDDRYDIFFDKLKPQLFRYNFEPNSGYTMGYIWQEAEQARIESNLERNDIGAITETDSVVGGKALGKQDFIALNTWQIQKLKTRETELEAKVADLETKIAKLLG